MRRESTSSSLEQDEGEAWPDTWPIPGIAGSTGIETSFGRVPAHLLRAGDMVRTRQHGFLRTVRVSDVKLDEDFLAWRPDAAPVIIPKDAFGTNQPARDVELSPAHPVFQSTVSTDGTGAPAASLSGRRGVIDPSLGMLVYVQVHLAQPAQINCDGIWVGAGVD